MSRHAPVRVGCFLGFIEASFDEDAGDPAPERASFETADPGANAGSSEGGAGALISVALVAS